MDQKETLQILTQRVEIAENHFNFALEPELIEAAIYEMNAARVILDGYIKRHIKNN